MKLKTWILSLLAAVPALLRAQTDDQVTAYINAYKQIAIAEMQRSGIPASIILAQGIHETQAGTSDLVLSSNNHFGIKCKTGWTGNVVYHDDDARGECFRSYATAADSYRDHSDFLMNSPRYASLFKLSPEDYSGWAYGLKKAGYATNNRYPQILIKLIEDYNLERYTLIALGKLSPETELLAINPDSAMKQKAIGGSPDSVTVNASHPDYPDHPFAINGARVIFARANISLLAISNQYEVPLPALLDYNDMPDMDILPNDQLIFLQRKRKTGMNPVHIVQTGENLYLISQTEGIRYKSLLELNHLSPGDEPAPGEKLFLQTISASRPSLKIPGLKKTAKS
ncbi:MAG TPA: glucosaminidase domain-containing protein [Puia sp.]|nr:glucosaminidase domain-containing protein [Puia sp.]